MTKTSSAIDPTAFLQDLQAQHRFDMAIAESYLTNSKGVLDLNNFISFTIQNEKTDASKTIKECRAAGFTVTGNVVQLPFRASVGMVMVDPKQEAKTGLKNVDAAMFAVKQRHHAMDPSLKRSKDEVIFD